MVPYPHWLLRRLTLVRCITALCTGLNTHLHRILHLRQRTVVIRAALAYPAARGKSAIGQSAALCMSRALVVDQQLVAAPDRPADALRALPSGGYTTVVIDGGRAEAWDDHVARLISSLGCLQRQDGQLGAAHLPAADGERKLADLTADLPRLIAPSLATALSAVRDGQRAHGAASSCRWMATILLCPRASSGCDPCSKTCCRAGSASLQAAHRETAPLDQPASAVQVRQWGSATAEGLCARHAAARPHAPCAHRRLSGRPAAQRSAP
jgi:hypothetical protein